jgi:AcrR family transcriptional regulator
MTSAGTATPGRRRHDAQASREALLDAADALFEERGYDPATVRDIGERAGLDPALIARYFGSKEGLYLATLQREGRAPVMPADPLAMLERVLSRTEHRGANPVGLAMVSPTLTDTCRDQVRDILAQRIVEPLTAELGADGDGDAQLRAEVIVALATGLTLTRASGTLPLLAEAPLADVLALMRPVLAALRPGAPR